MAATGHPDVRRRAPTRFTERHVRSIDRFALCSVDGRAERELHVLVHVGSREHSLTGSTIDDEPAVGTSGEHSPVVAIRYTELTIVSSRRDTITGTDALTTTRDRLTTALTTQVALVVPAIPDPGVQRCDLVAGVGDDQLIAACTDDDHGVRALDFGGVDHDLPS